jgi:hypothetical protein
MLKKIILAIIVIALLIFTVIGAARADSNHSVLLNSSNVPLVDYGLVLNLSVSPYSIVGVERLDNVSDVGVAFNESFVVGNISSFPLVFNISFNGSNVSLNRTLSFNLTSNATHLFSLHKIFLFYNHTRSDDLVNISGESYMTVLNGDFVLNYSADLLPVKGFLDYEVAGLYGDKLLISCSDGWISCPLVKTFGVDNKTVFQVDYQVPISAGLGSHSFDVNLSMGNLSRSTKVVFNIAKANVEFSSFEFEDSCFVPTSGGVLTVTYDCILEKEEHDIKRLADYIEKIRGQYEEDWCLPEEVNNTEYVVVGDVDADVKGLFDSCVADKDNVNNKLSETSGMLSQCNYDLGVCQDTIFNEESSCLSSVFNASVVMKQNSERHRRNTYLILVCLVVVLLISWFVYNWIIKSGKEGIASW